MISHGSRSGSQWSAEKSALVAEALAGCYFGAMVRFPTRLNPTAFRFEDNWKQTPAQ